MYVAKHARRISFASMYVWGTLKLHENDAYSSNILIPKIEYFCLFAIRCITLILNIRIADMDYFQATPRIDARDVSERGRSFADLSRPRERGSHRRRSLLRPPSMVNIRDTNTNPESLNLARFRLGSVKIFLFIQVPPHRPRLRLPLEPDVPSAADPSDRHRQRKGGRQGVPEGRGAGHPG